jgi:hypothetical protein
MIRKKRRIGWILGTFAFAGLLIVALFVVSFGGSAHAQTSDNNCIVAAGGASNCTANDFGITNIELLTVLSPCTGPGSVATVTMRLTAMVGSPERYDVGYFISTDGSSDAINGSSCYHSFLQPLAADDNSNYDPTGGAGPFWQGEATDTSDICGDSEGNNQQITFDTLESFGITCVDTDNDGFVDVQACASYDNNQQNTCTGPAGAIPGTPSKCGCSIFNFPFTPTAVTLSDVSASGNESAIAPLLAAFGILAVATFFLLRRVRARQPV